MALTGLEYTLTGTYTNLPPTIYQTGFFSDAPIAATVNGFSDVADIIAYLDQILGTNDWSGTTLYWACNPDDILSKGRIAEDVQAIFPNLKFLRVNPAILPTPPEIPLSLNDGYIFSAAKLALSGGSGDATGGRDTAIGWSYDNGLYKNSSPFASRVDYNYRQVNIYFAVMPLNWIKDGKLSIPLTSNPICKSVTITLYYTSNKFDTLNPDNTKVSYGENEFVLSTEDIRHLNNQPFVIIGDDPYSPGGSSEGGGGGGSFDDSTDGIGLPGLPSIQLSDLGFFNLYNPAGTQIRALADYMWSDVPNWDDFKKVMANPMDAIIGLSCVPVSPTIGAAKEVAIGNIKTGVYMTPVTNQWVSHNCGTIKIPEYWGSYLDYAPYTQMQLYLPYIGCETVSANDIISHAGKNLTLQYNVDVLSGACVASLLCGPDVLYNWQGTCGMQVPFTSLTYGNLITGLMQVGMGAVSALASPASGLSSMISGATSMYNQDISHGGGIGGAGGFLGIQRPYLIISRPNMCMPLEQNKFIGYPSHITVNLSDLKGYTEIDSIHIENVPASEAELLEMETLLKSGVIM